MGSMGRKRANWLPVLALAFPVVELIQHLQALKPPTDVHSEATAARWHTTVEARAAWGSLGSLGSLVAQARSLARWLCLNDTSESNGLSSSMNKNAILRVYRYTLFSDRSIWFHMFIFLPVFLSILLWVWWFWPIFRWPGHFEPPAGRPARKSHSNDGQQWKHHRKHRQHVGSMWNIMTSKESHHLTTSFSLGSSWVKIEADTAPKTEKRPSLRRLRQTHDADLKSLKDAHSDLKSAQSAKDQCLDNKNLDFSPKIWNFHPMLLLCEFSVVFL